MCELCIAVFYCGVLQGYFAHIFELIVARWRYMAS